jgi:hypothetical protein
LLALVVAKSADAVIVYGSQGRNTSAPTGALANAGWQWEGQFGSFLGTAIGSQYFITAQHIGGSTGTGFFYNNVNYSIDPTFGSGNGYVNIGGTDLRVWKVTGTLPSYAPLYGAQSGETFGSETGKALFDVGRGLQRGNPVTILSAQLYSGTGTISPGATNPILDIPAPTSPPAGSNPSSNPRPGGSLTAIKGWDWGTYDGLQSWGTNTATGTLTDPTLGKFVYFDFTENASPNEGILAPGDSGGGLFIDATGNGNWELAGVNYGVDAFFRGTPNGNTLSAALFDESGLYMEGSTSSAPYVYVPQDGFDHPANSFDSSISGNISAIESLIGGSGAASVSDGIPAVPEPGAIGIVCFVGAGMFWRRRT